MKDKDVVTLGEYLVALSASRGERLRHAGCFFKSAAGSESNVAIGLARLGYRSGWMGLLGDDEFGDFLYSFLRGEGVDLEVPKGILGLFFGCIAIYGALFSIGYFIFGCYVPALIWGSLSILCLWIVLKVMRRLGVS